MIKGVIFDLDGVLTNTSEYHYKAWRRLARERLGYDFSKKDNDAFLGVSRKECMLMLEKMAGKTLSEEQKEEYLKLKNGYYLNYLSELTPDNLNEGARTLIKECKCKGLKLAVASASKNTKVVLEKTGINDCFDVIVDGNSVSKTKPDPECFLLAAEGLMFKPQQCIVIEDAQAGIDGANAGGFVSIGIGKRPLHNTYRQFENINVLDIKEVLQSRAKETI